MKPNPLKSRCIACGNRPRGHHGGCNSNFVACECRGECGGHVHLIYGGWDLPKEWRLDRWYALRFHTVKFIRWVLAV